MGGGGKGKWKKKKKDEDAEEAADAGGDSEGESSSSSSSDGPKGGKGGKAGKGKEKGKSKLYSDYEDAVKKKPDKAKETAKADKKEGDKKEEKKKKEKKGKGKGSKKEEQHDEERRIDPEDGTELTFSELSSWYGGYSKKALDEYWSHCTPIGAKGGKSKNGKGDKGDKGSNGKGGKGKKGNGHGGDEYHDMYREPKGKGKGKGSQLYEEERRVDPHDGGLYTFDEIAAFYKGQYSWREVEEYWYYSCEAAHRSGKGSKKGSKARGDAEAAPRTRQSPQAAPAYVEEPEETKASKPRAYVANFNSTEEIALSMKACGWSSIDVGDPNNHNSILVSGGRKLNPLRGSVSDAPDLPMGLRVRAEELSDLLQGLILAGGEDDFPGIAFACLPRDGDVKDALLDALGVRKAARREVTLEETSWSEDFTDQQMGSQLSPELAKATELLKNFGTTYEMNFSEVVSCAPALYFAQSKTSYSSEQPVLGVIHTRVWH